MTDEYFSVAAPVHAETSVRGSRFLAFVAPVRTPEAALHELEAMRRTYHDATHHCFAYRIGPEGNHERFSDSGEPSGTAGRPILLTLQHGQVSDVVLVVTRYFGGTKLGVGGLRRAYAEAAATVLRRAGKVQRLVLRTLRVEVPVGLVGDVISTAARAGGKAVRMEYGTEAVLTIEVRRSRAEELCRMLIDRTSGKARVIES